MPIIPLSCPNCGAQLEANSDDSILTCKYCGGNFVMKDAIVHNYIQNTVNITAGTVNVVSQKDFVIEGGVLKKYQGEAVDVVIPNNVFVIEEAFKGLRIKSVTIPDSVTEIGDHAFAGCASLKSVTIPDSVTSIVDCAFEGCTSLTSVTIPDSVTSIDGCAFYRCTSLKSVTIPNSVTAIGLSVFAGCTSLTSVTIPDSVTEIGYDAFAGCTSLTSVTIPDSVTTIGAHAFEECTSLTSVTIPDSVTTIGDGAFYKCRSLTSITAPVSIWPRKWNDCFAGTPPNYWYMEGRCLHCGGSFKGLLTQKCSVCHLPKDY